MKNKDGGLLIVGVVALCWMAATPFPAEAGGAAVRPPSGSPPPLPPEVREQLRERVRQEREEAIRAQQILRRRAQEKPAPSSTKEDELEPSPARRAPYVPPRQVLVSPADSPNNEAAPTGFASEESAAFQALLGRLDQSTQAWRGIPDIPTKIQVVNYYRRLYARYGIKINKEALRYVSLVDSLAGQNHSVFQRPFDEVLRFLAILEYDYDDGTDKDALARSLLTEEGFRKNKKRLGLAP